MFAQESSRWLKLSLYPLFFISLKLKLFEKTFGGTELEDGVK